MVLNEFEKNTEFYSLFPLEAHVRRITDNQNNSYLIVLVACCRENYNPKVHGSCVGANSKQEAEEIFAKKKEEKELEEQEKLTDK